MVDSPYYVLLTRIQNKTRIKRTEWSTTLGVNWRISKHQELHAPRKQEECCILLWFETQASPSRITPVSAALRWLYIFRADFDFFVLRTQRREQMLNDMLSLGTLSDCLRCRALAGTYLHCCAGLIAPYFAVFVAEARRQHCRTYIKSSTKQSK